MTAPADANKLQDDESGMLLNATLADIIERERAARERLEVLAEASLILSQSLNYRTTLDNLGRVLIPRFADNVIIDLLNERGEFQLASISASQPEAEAAMRELRHSYPPDPKAGAARHALETRQPLLVPELDDAFYARVALNEHHLGLMKVIGGRSMMVVPLIVRDEAIGTMSFGYAESERRYSSDDILLAQDLAQRAALAVEHARLYRAARRESHRRLRTQKRLRAITDNLPVLISYVDAEGYYRFNSRGYEAWFGKPLSEITGRRFYDVLGKGVAARIKPYIDEVLAGQPSGYTAPIPHQDGTMRWVDTRYIPDIGPDGVVRGFFAMIADITEHRRAQDYAELYADVVKHIQVGIAIFELEDPDDPASLRLIAVNPVTDQMTGANAAQNVGKRIYEAFPHLAGTGRAERYAEAARSDEGIDLGEVHIPPTEYTREMFLSVKAFPLPGSRTGVSYDDITDLKQIQNRLTGALDRTRALYEISRRINMAMSVQEVLDMLLTSPDLQRAERAAVLVFDRPWDDTEPEYQDIIAHWHRFPNAPALTSGMRLSFRDFGTGRLVTRNEPCIVADIDTDERVADPIREAMRKVGTRSFILLPLVAGAHFYGILSIQSAAPFQLSDEEMTHLQGLVDQAASAIYTLRLLDSEAQARIRAERAVQDRMRFLAMVSHELRTPLASIKGFASTLLSEDVSWDAESQLIFTQVIDDEADRLSELVEQVLDLSRLEVGTLSISIEQQALPTILAEAMPQLTTICAHHELALSVPGTMPLVHADKRRISQVLANLVSNACKYSADGSRIEIKAVQTGSMVKVSVCDEGVGIPASERQSVFETFRQASNRPLAETRGVGLGLSIARALVEAHGGQIWVEDREGPGTTISFTLKAVG